MIADKFVDLYARNSGVRDKLIAERDIVLTYALRVLLDATFQRAKVRPLLVPSVTSACQSSSLLRPRPAQREAKTLR